MAEIVAQRTIAAPADRVWEALADVGGVHRFHPYVERSPLIGRLPTGLGSRRRCDFYNGKHVLEEVTGWDEGRSMTITVTDGTMPVASAQARLAVAPRGPGRTEVTFEMVYAPQPGVVGKVVDVLMMRAMFRRMLRRILEGLEEHLTSGAVIGRDGRPLPAPSAA